MSVVKTLLCRFGHLLLSIVRSLRKAICCRRKKETEYLLPMTVGQIIGSEQNMESNYESVEYKSQWEAWPEAANVTSMNNRDIPAVSENDTQATNSDECTEDFFKDMVPQIRRPKKIYVWNEDKNLDQEQKISNRLAMDPKAILQGPDLGLIEENSSTWEESESLNSWEPDLLIQEKRAQQEKRRADHQRRKMEKEGRKSSGPETLANILNLDAKDKNKYS